MNTVYILYTVIIHIEFNFKLDPLQVQLVDLIGDINTMELWARNISVLITIIVLMFVHIKYILIGRIL